MDKINKLFETIKAIRQFNSYCKDIQPDTESLGYYTLKNLSDLTKKMEWLSDFDPDLFFLELSCSIASHTACENANRALYSEIQEYIEWYNLNRDSVSKLTSYGQIHLAVETTIPNTKAGRDLKAAWNALIKAEQDKYVHQMLARAYESIAGHGSQYEKLSSADKETLDSALKDYQEHFKVTQVDLPQMYEDYHTASFEEYLEAKTRLAEARQILSNERLRTIEQIKVDMHQYVASLLWPYMHYLQEKSNSSSEAKDTTEIRSLPGRKPLGIFDSFEDMFNNHDHFIVIDNYIRTKGNLNIGEAKSIFTAIKRPEDNILKERVSTEHFGTLIKKQYRLICSFDNGKSVADGKIFKDVESTIKALLGIPETTKTK